MILQEKSSKMLLRAIFFLLITTEIACNESAKNKNNDRSSQIHDTTNTTQASEKDIETDKKKKDSVTVESVGRIGNTIKDNKRIFTPQQIAKSAFPSVALLLMQDKFGKTISLGSGFFVRKNLIATNLHVIKGAVKGVVKLIGQQKSYEINTYAEIDSKNDLALIVVNDAKEKAMLVDDASVEIGETVYAIGNPEGLEGTFSQGIISSIRKIGSEHLIQLTAPISPGSSGGPVMNEQGKVIGISVATFKEGQNLNFAIPSDALVKLLAKTPEELSQTSLEALSSSQESQAIVSEFGRNNIEGVMASDLNYQGWTRENGSKYYKIYISIENSLQYSVDCVSYIINFYNSKGRPVHYIQKTYYGEQVPPGSAVRVPVGEIEGETFDIIKYDDIKIIDFKMYKDKK